MWIFNLHPRDMAALPGWPSSIHLTHNFGFGTGARPQLTMETELPLGYVGRLCTIAPNSVPPAAVFRAALLVSYL